MTDGTAKVVAPPKEDTFGNLLFFNNQLISQTIMEVSAYPLEK
jgi:hypothetical protein